MNSGDFFGTGTDNFVLNVFAGLVTAAIIYALQALLRTLREANASTDKASDETGETPREDAKQADNGLVVGGLATFGELVWSAVAGFFRGLVSNLQETLFTIGGLLLFGVVVIVPPAILKGVAEVLATSLSGQDLVAVRAMPYPWGDLPMIAASVPSFLVVFDSLGRDDFWSLVKYCLVIVALLASVIALNAWLGLGALPISPRVSGEAAMASASVLVATLGLGLGSLSRKKWLTASF